MGQMLSPARRLSQGVRKPCDIEFLEYLCDVPTAELAERLTGGAQMSRMMFAIAALLLAAADAAAQPAEPFFARKTITISIGYTAGGSYDLYGAWWRATSAGTFRAGPRSSPRTCRAPAR
jgi:hypothetical protein